MFSMQDSIQNFLSTSDAAGSVMAHARLLIRLRLGYAKFAPAALSQSSTVANYKQGIVVIHADNGAVAAKLRQIATTLANDFCKMGIECNDVQIRVQASQPPEKIRTLPHRPLSVRASGALDALAKDLPDSALKQALQNLLTRVSIDKT